MSATNEANVTRNPLDCSNAVAMVHRLLDQDAVGPEDRQRLSDHEAGCASCAALERDLNGLCLALRRAGAPPMTERGLERVWARTTGRRPHVRRGWRSTARLLATAASLLLAAWSVTTLYLDAGPSSPFGGAPSTEIAHAETEIRLAFALVARQIERTETVALDHVVREGFAPALAKIPLFSNWNADPAAMRETE